MDTPLSHDYHCKLGFPITRSVSGPACQYKRGACDRTHFVLEFHVARRIRLLEKKRGGRRTGSPRLGFFGEAAFFAVLLLLGLISLTTIIALQIEYSTARQLFFLGWGLWLRLAVAATFILIGGVGVVYSVMQVSASAERRSTIGLRKSDSGKVQGRKKTNYPTIPTGHHIEGKTGTHLAYSLPIAHSPVWQVLSIALFCGVCVTLASISVVFAGAQHLDGRPKWALTGIAVLALVLGIWSVYLFVRRLLIFTDVGPTRMEISDFPLRPGRQYRLFFSQSGRLLMESLEVRLICEETATFQDGTDIRTERLKVVEQQVFLEEQLPIHPGEPFETEHEFEFPEAAMHSFQSGSNSVNWWLAVLGTAPPWPPFQRKFPLVVLPTDTEESVP